MEQKSEKYSSSLSPFHALLHALGSIGCSPVGLILRWSTGDRDVGYECTSWV